MSGAQVSAWQTPNELLTSMETPALVQRNQLLNQETQQTLNANEMEQISRASNWVISQDPENKDPAKQALAYGAAVKLLRANNFAKNAPEQYPGFDAMQMMARQGTPSKDLYQQTQDSAWANANKIGGGGAPGATAPPADGGAGGFSSDKETARRQVLQQETGGEANPATALNYVARADPTAYARGATASGKYQFVNSTWREGMQLAGLDPAQYPTARDAPDKVQDQVFDAIYAKYGTKPWEKGPKDWVKDEQGRYQLATVRPPPGSPGGAPVTAAAAPPGGGVVARNPGAVQVAGPGAGPPAAATAPAATPDLMGPRPLPPIGPGSPVVTPQSLANTPAPQNALAPPSPPAAPPPAAPAATAPAASAPPPPAINLPPIPPPTPVNPATRLTTAQEQELNGLLPLASRSREGQAAWVARKQAMIEHNDAEQRQYAVDVAARQDKVQAQQERAVADARAAATQQREEAAAAALAEQRRVENARSAETQRLAEQTAAEARAKAIDLTLEGGDDGSQRYAAAYATKAAPKTNLDGSTVIPNMTAYDKPTYRGGKGQDTGVGGPDYGTVKTTPPTQMNATQSLAAGFADRMRNSLPVISDTSPAAMNRWQQLLGKVPLAGNSLVTPEFQQHLQAERDFINAVLRKESGAAISESEFVNARQQYIPQPGDKPEVLAQKAKNREQVLANLIRDAGPAYKPAEAPASQAAPVTVKTPEEAQALSPGTVYKTPDGKTFKR